MSRHFVFDPGCMSHGFSHRTWVNRHQGKPASISIARSSSGLVRLKRSGTPNCSWLSCTVSSRFVPFSPKWLSKVQFFELGPGMTPCEGNGGGCNRVRLPPPLSFFFITDNSFFHLRVGAHNTKWDNHMRTRTRLRRFDPPHANWNASWGTGGRSHLPLCYFFPSVHFSCISSSLSTAISESR